ncbi:MAG: twin-arginine translocation signal domain-containing protein, partial [Chitinivibrionales bacterium]|nr:twin-arginine translocation signal domain-containing protein [Chitinivibrionales bacterium]
MWRWLMRARFSNSRRRFLKSSAAGAAGVAATAVVPAKARSRAEEPWPDIHPEIDNLRVVCGFDAEMVNKDCEDLGNFSDFGAQNNAVNRDVVRENMDRMAMELAQKSTAAEAWTTVFQKTAGEDWSGKKVAMKINCIPKNHVRVAVIEKVCDELNAMGVPYTNMVLYDGQANPTNL